MYLAINSATTLPESNDQWYAAAGVSRSANKIEAGHVSGVVVGRRKAMRGWLDDASYSIIPELKSVQIIDKYLALIPLPKFFPFLKTAIFSHINTVINRQKLLFFR
jgi:hypothetical protein